MLSNTFPFSASVDNFKKLSDGIWVYKKFISDQDFEEKMGMIAMEGLRNMEKINHPPHYGGEGNTYETIKVIRAWNLGFSLGNAVKYLSRAGKKDPATRIEDLKKAVWYIQEEIDYETKRSITGTTTNF
jgi:hypothetical protein